MNQRRYDIDALRSIAMFLLIFYHLGISFTSLARQTLFIQNKRVVEGIWPLLNLMNNWRIPLVFLIAGIALRLSFRKRTRIQIFKERSKILILPWVFGTLVFSSSSAYIVGRFYDYWFLDEFSDAVFFALEYEGLHLWFLINIFIYCLVLIPILNFISKENFVASLLSKPGGVFLFSLPIIAEGHLLNLSRFRNRNIWRLLQRICTNGPRFCTRVSMVFYRHNSYLPRRCILGIEWKELEITPGSWYDIIFLQMV